MKHAPESPARVSLADVARLAGVSSNTVSRVVRGDREVSDATRARIQAIIEEVGYRPNFAARALAARRTGVVHVLVAAPMFLGHSQTLLSVVSAATARGLHATVSNVYGRDGRLDRHTMPFHMDAVIILGGKGSTVEFAQEVGRRVPTVLLLAEERDLDGVSTVSVDNALGSRLGTQHLVDLGVRDLVHLAGPMEWSDAVRRREGFEAVCEESGVRSRVLEAGSWRAMAGHDLVSRLGELPEAFVAANDQLALGAMRALHERGVRIPEAVRMVGFDDFDGVECFVPPLTTVRQSFERVGRTALEQVTSLVDGGEHRDVLIEPELVVRASSGGPVRASARV